MDKRFPLAAVGNVSVDLIMGPVPPVLDSGTERIVENNELRVGGSAGNSALAWSALGVAYQFAASTGDDQFGLWLRSTFGDLASKWPTAPTETSLSVGITHPDGERTFLSTRGHLPVLAWREIEAMLDWQELRGGVLLLCGAFLTTGLATDYAQLFDHAKANDVQVALDTGWPLDGWTRQVRADAIGWIARSDYLMFNEIEATSLAERDNVEAAARWLLEHMPENGTVIVKRGPEGALLLRRDCEIAAPAPNVEVIDTIGAGDVFNAAFLAARAERLDWDQALQQAIATASLAISTQPRLYTRAGLEG
jgi:sugar/nucleoside kinase (ribokinase family)